jgi:hypothetical protein
MNIENFPRHAQHAILKFFNRPPAKNTSDERVFFHDHRPKVVIVPPRRPVYADLMPGSEATVPDPVFYQFTDGDPRVRYSYETDAATLKYAMPPDAAKPWLDIRRGYMQGKPVCGIRLTNEGRRVLFLLEDVAAT